MPRPVIDKNRCSDSGICVDICPVDVFEKDDKGNVFVAKPDECIGCRACEAQCPKSAIIVED